MSHSPPIAPHELYAYEPPISLWSLVESYVPQHEWQEVKLILGEFLVEQSLELHSEVQTLLEIWRDYRCETENKPLSHRLPEPPDARERLKQEIKFFVTTIREKSDENGRSDNDLFSLHNKNVLDYVFDKKTSDKRPGTAKGSQTGRDTPMVAKTPDRLSMSSTVSDDVDAMQDKLNFLKLDEVVQHLRETMSQEVEWLMNDIDFLQECLEKEADYRSLAETSREPTLTDLRETRSKLEKELLTAESPVPHVLRTQGLSPIKPVTSRPSSGAININRKNSATKRSPLKAQHDLATVNLTLSESATNKVSTNRSSPNSVPGIGAGRGPSKTTSQAPSLSGDSPGNAKDRLLSESPSHVTIRTATLPNNGTVLAVSTVPACASDSKLYTPSPPASTRPSVGRPGSAQRFRSMVLQCRDDT